MSRMFSTSHILPNPRSTENLVRSMGTFSTLYKNFTISTVKNKSCMLKSYLLCHELKRTTNLLTLTSNTSNSSQLPYGKLFIQKIFAFCLFNCIGSQDLRAICSES